MKKIYFVLFLLWGINYVQAVTLVDGLYYELNNSMRTATLAPTDVSGEPTYSGNIVIPESISYNGRTYDVVGIDKYAFTYVKDGWTTGQPITSVKIPSSIKEIGDYAFIECTSLSSVEIDEGVTKIGNGAFYYCPSLLSISIPNTVTYIGDKAFRHCISLATVEMSENVTYIGHYAFTMCSKLNSITIPETLRDMGDCVFYNCTNLKTIVWNAVHCSDFTSSTVAPFSGLDKSGHDDPFYGVSSAYSLNYNDYTTSVVFGQNVEYIPAYLCYNFFRIPSLSFPDKVKVIGERAFFSSYSRNGSIMTGGLLVSVSFGNGLEKIDTEAFCRRTGLTSITIPDNCTEIGRYAFGGCDNLTTITIGKNIKTIVAYAFAAQDYASINTINIYANTPPTITADVFDGYSDLMAITLNVRSTALAAYQNATVWKDMYIQTLENDLRTFTLSVSSSDENHGITTVGGTFDEDTEVLIYASAKEGYQFSQWNDGNKDNPRTVKMTGNLTYVAQFIPNLPTYSLSVASTNETQGSVLGSGSYEVGSSVTIAAIAKNGYTFSQWQDGNTNNPRIVQVTTDALYFASFVPSAIETPKYTLSVMSTNNTQGTAFGSGEYESGTSLLIAAFANDGYHFTQWQDGNTDNPRIITTEAANTYYFASFEQEDVPPTLYDLNIAPEIAAQGWTSEGCAYEFGTQVMIYAHPAEGFVFSQWSDGNKENPRFVTMNSSIDLVAQFEVQPTGNTSTTNDSASTARKFLRNGQLFILRDGKVYSVQGQEVR